MDKNGKIYVGIPRERFFFPAFVDNRDRIFNSLINSGRYCGYFNAEGHRVDKNRDAIVEAFLLQRERPEWLLMLDSDMEHPSDIGEALASNNLEVVGGLYFHRGLYYPMVFRYLGTSQDRYGRPSPLWKPLWEEVYRFMQAHGVPDSGGAMRLRDADGDRLLGGRGFGIGGGSMLIHRDVLEALSPPWFEYRGGPESEDLSFCRRVTEELNLGVWCDLSVVSGHYTVAPVGWAQFRSTWLARGYRASQVERAEATHLLATFYSISHDEAESYLDSYDTEKMRRLWKELNGAKDPLQFYKNPKVGELYILDLLHWNMGRGFNALRAMLMKQRDLNALEIGSGIGTVAMQLALQGCNVTAVEPNQVLREFSAMRWDMICQREQCSRDSIRFVESLQEATETYDLAVAIDVLEHIHPDELGDTLRDIGMRLRRGAEFFHHNNWWQQEIYPFHYNHAEIFERAMAMAGFFVRDALHSIKTI